MSKTMTLELSLENVRIDKVRSSRKCRRMVIVSLVWPRPRIAERVALKTLDFESNTVDLSRSTWTGKILFKEVVLGPFGIEVGITERISDPQAERFFRFLGSSLSKIAGSEAKGLVMETLGGNLAKLPFSYLSKVIAQPGDEGPNMISSGTLDIEPDKMFKSGRRVRLEVELAALRTIHRAGTAKGKGGKRGKRRLIVRAGDVNGVAVLSAKRY